jgi:hypothetical protein
MVEVGVVARKAVTRLREVDQGYVSGMEEVNVAKLLTALKVLKATQVSAFHMVVVAGVSLRAVQREHRGAPCSAKLMEVASDASSRIATRVPKAVHLFVKDMVVASVACMMEVEYAQRVCMEALSFVLHMVVGNGVQLRCGKSARGRTDHCVKHGGGKRCKVDGCGKSAQGSTDFCKAHGGGKRCQWGVEGSTAADSLKDSNGGRAAGAPCDKFARGKSGLCAAHSALVQDRRVHGGGTVGNVVTAGLAPGLFRGLVSGSGQTRPRTINSSTTISGPSTTPVAASSRAATSASDKEMGSAAATQGFDLHGKLQFCSLVFVLQQLVWRPVCKLRSFQTLLNS